MHSEREKKVAELKDRYVKVSTETVRSKKILVIVGNLRLHFRFVGIIMSAV